MNPLVLSVGKSQRLVIKSSFSVTMETESMLCDERIIRNCLKTCVVTPLGLVTGILTKQAPL